jgi:hypothetical protein
MNGLLTTLLLVNVAVSEAMNVVLSKQEQFALNRDGKKAFSLFF